MRRWASPALVTPVVLLVACGEGSAPRAPEGPSLLLVTVDTLRADHVGAYGHDRATTPHLDALAARGVRFADVTVQWPKTWPSLASALTGTYPATTGVDAHHRLLAPHNHTVAELLHAAGFRTAAVVANVNLSRAFGWDQGFERFVESWSEALREGGSELAEIHAVPGAVKRYTDARRVTDQALDCLDTLDSDERFFLWIHYMDPHGPYQPPAEYAEPFLGSYPAEPVRWSEIPAYQRVTDPETHLVDDDLGRYRARYDGEIRFFDSELGRLLEGLEARRSGSDTLVAVTADHGESLSEHGYYLEHGLLPYQPTARVPLVLAWPGRLPEGRVVSAPVGLVGLAATLLELLGVPAPPDLAGHSLAGLALGGEADAPEAVFMQAGYGEPSQVVIRSGRWKLVHFPSEPDREAAGAREWELFDLEADPLERRSVLDERPEVAEALRARLTAWLEATPRSPPGELPGAVDPTTRALLEQLGYTVK